ncbi:MAG: response regulator [Chloroflexi bacterium]|nr:MAG: response regulator [Chloroflexota bacterium]
MPKRILVVEDEANIRQTLRYNLVKEGYEVSEAGTGPEALNEARRIRPRTRECRSHDPRRR